jgi:micrococcal nuclease
MAILYIFLDSFYYFLFYNKNIVRFGRILPHIFIAILVVIFVLLNDSSLKQNEVTKQSSINQKLSTKEAAKVLKVIDGDTIKVSLNNREDTVRLIGIDSPEILDKNKTVQCFGKEASDKAKEILNGKTIILESDPTQGERDEYGRLLRYVFLEDGTNFDKFMISEGYAREYTFKGNSYKYQSEFIQAEKKAKGLNKGLWGSC